MIPARLDDEHVARHVLGQHEPAPAAFLARDAADAQPAPLPQRIVHEAVVAADHAPGERLHFARLRGQKLLEERLEAPLADEAHAGRVLFGAGGQPRVARELAHLRLGQIADWEHRLTQRSLPQHIEEVALVLVAVRAAQ